MKNIKLNALHSEGTQYTITLTILHFTVFCKGHRMFQVPMLGTHTAPPPAVPPWYPLHLPLPFTTGTEPQLCSGNYHCMCMGYLLNRL